MKICWDNLEKVKYSKRTGNFFEGNHTYYYRDTCAGCGEPYLGRVEEKYCSSVCHNQSPERRNKMKELVSGKNNGMYRKKHTTETRDKMKANHACVLGKDNPNWKGGISCEPYCDAWKDKEYKDWIKHHRDSGKCQNPKCDGKFTKVCLHHINYDKQDCRPLNLITLCISCNSKANKCREWYASFYSDIIKGAFNEQK